jgi:hypothetical protein
VRVAAAVRGARHREVLGAEPEALRHAGAHARQRLERLGRRARVDRRAGIGGRAAAGGVRAAAAAAVGRRPGDAVLALDAGAAPHAHQRLADHDARTW